MSFYCLRKCRKFKFKNFNNQSWWNNVIKLCSICGGKTLIKNKIHEKQEPSGILSNLGLKTPVTKDPSTGDHKMNEIANRFLLAGDKFMPEST